MRRPAPAAEPAGVRIAYAALLVALPATVLVVDPSAAAAFDAPKRLVAGLGTALAAAALTLAPGGWWSVGWRAHGRAARAAAALVAGALAWAALSAALSRHPAGALDGLWMAGVAALLLGLGASRALERGRAARLLGAYVAAAVASAALAVIQAAGLWQPLPIRSLTGRTDAIALIGNEGLLALVLALAVVACAAPVLGAADRRTRRRAAAALAVLAGGLAVCASLTALAAAAAGVATLVAVLAPRRARRIALAAALALAAIAVLPPVRGRLAELAQVVREGHWDQVASGRLAPWAAALEMVRERPLVGHGPGTFEAEYVPHRVAAEVRLRRRLVHPTLAAHHDHAHSEPLQVAAAIGLPGALAVLGAAVALILSIPRVLVAGGAARREAAVACALLAAGAAAALLWFPFARPVTAMPLLLAAGRLWRLGGGSS